MFDSPAASGSEKSEPYGEQLCIKVVDIDKDQNDIWSLYKSGLLEGELSQNDSAADIDNLKDAYFSDNGWSNFWKAVLNNNGTDTIIGIVGVQRIDEHTAEIMRLRVHPMHRQRGVGSRLIEESLSFCRHKGYLKIILDTRIERAPAVALFKRAGFQLNRTRDAKGKKILDFYLDLYRQSKEE